MAKTVEREEGGATRALQEGFVICPVAGIIEEPGGAVLDAEAVERKGRVLIVLGHPRVDSFCAALARSYGEAAESFGLEVHTLVLAHLEFDPHVRSVSPRRQALEPDLEMAREAIVEADHLVFVYPLWWGMMPALLKGFLDRVLMPGFAFTERTGGQGYAGLLQGKSAQLLTTMDTPPAVVKFLLGSPGHRAFSVSTLKFCGIWPVRVRSFGPVKTSSEARRRKWLREAHSEAALIASGRLTGREARLARVGSWIRALRLHFYPMTWLAYTAGASLLMPLPDLFFSALYWWGYLVLFLIEAATVFLNEVFDYETDRRNTDYGPFSGGSRVLVSGQIDRGQLVKAAFLALGGSLVVLAGLLLSPLPMVPILLTFLIAVFLGVGYTVPPLKLSHRGFGELTVAFTHSFLVVQAGALAAGGTLFSSEVFLLSLPLFFAVLPSIVLSGIPDRIADAAAEKRTMAVQFGRKGALQIALGATVVTILAYFITALTGGTQLNNPLQVAGPLLHGAILIGWALRALRCPERSQRTRLDGLMALSLSFILWFVLLPLFFPGEP